MAIRILHVVNNLGKGGLENGLVNLIEHLDAGWFEHVVCAVRQLGPNADRLRGRARIECLGEGGSGSQMPALVRMIRKSAPDIVHSRNWAAIEAVMAGRWTRNGALVHSEHGLDAENLAGEPWRRRGFRRLAFELADRVFSVSYQLRELHAQRTGFPARRIGVIHNGVDQKRFSPNPGLRARMRREMGLADNEFCIGCVGNLSPVKDYPTLIAAVGEFAGAVRDWRLVIVGEGPERPKIEALVNVHDWRDKVNFFGLSDRVPEILQALDVYVLPSISEGISNSLLEAMATGVPVVATATGGNPEVVVEGESGLLFPVGDKNRLSENLVRLHVRREFRLQLGEKALARVRDEFSVESMVRNYTQLYLNLAEMPERVGV